MATARRANGLVLMYAGATWCEPCRRLAKEFERPAVQDELSRWVLVHLDVDESDDAHRLHIGSIPAIRLYAADGRALASREGFVAGDDLVKWLAEARTTARAAGAAAGTAADAPDDAPTLARRVADLAASDPVVREIAIRRLTPQRGAAATQVAALLEKGKLAGRLSALELLSAWKAPVEGLDPWEPSTVTAERLTRVRQWAADVSKLPATRPTTTAAAKVLVEVELDAARTEIARLIAEPDPAAALAARERLARLGESLLPEVRRQLQEPGLAADARQRLLALRYRLVASDVVGIRWTGLVDQLASPDSRMRHEAATALIARATPADVPLLLELFEDPDPLMREISLRAIQGVGGPRAVESLVRLLADPDANVRAAVLGQLAETPSEVIVPRLVEYVARERDPDLVVHAVRALRATHTRASVDALVSLTTHESWRVRAEAVDALAEIAQGSHGSDEETRKLTEPIYPALVKRLEDPEGFVAGRALQGLRRANYLPAAAAIAKVAESRPELAPDVVRALTAGDEMTAASAALLEKFTRHPDAAVRAAAVEALGSLSSKTGQSRISGNVLRDDSARVRLAGAESMLAALEKLRPERGYVTRSTWFGLSEERVKVDPDQWLKDFRAGKTSPPWLKATAPDVAAGVEQARGAVGSNGELGEDTVASAALLAAAGQDDKAWPVLTWAAKHGGPQAARAAAALPWLAWERRAELCGLLTQSAGDTRTLESIARQMSAMPDARAAGPLWALLARPAADVEVADAVFNALRMTYFGQEYYDRSTRNERAVKQMASDATAALKQSNEPSKLVALALLSTTSTDEAQSAAKAIYNDAGQSAAMRADALQVLLATGKRADGQALALAALKHPAAEPKRVALQFLADRAGEYETHYLRERISLDVTIDPSAMERSERPYDDQGHPLPPKAPPGITADLLRPLLKDPDENVAGYAAYLLTLLRDHEGQEALVAHWRKHTDDYRWRPLTYRALTATNDDVVLPLLEEINATFRPNDYERQEFYWLLTRMPGPAASRLAEKVKLQIRAAQLR